MKLESLRQMAEQSDQTGCSVYEMVIESDMQERSVSREESFQKMTAVYHAMKHADASYDPSLSSHSGMAGGDGEKLKRYRESGKSLLGDFTAEVMEKAVKMAESNACMKRIVAAPTAGSCGVIPAVLLTYEEKRGASEEKMTEALYVTAGIGSILAERASIAGAEGGCQAEIGSASAMAAAAVAYLEGGDAECSVHAAALALKSMLGLVCDPVAGLVEVPCIKRNVLGAVNAVTSAQMALAGIRSVIPPDEVIDAMREVGRSMSPDLKETGRGGLAQTQHGREIAQHLRENSFTSDPVL